MEKTVLNATVYCQIFRYDFAYHLQWLRMRGKWETGQEKRGEDEEVITDYRITENYRDKDPETGFEDNGFNRKELEKIIDEYKPSEKPKGCNKQYQPKNNTDKNDNPENLFDVLPFRDTDTPGTEEDRKPYVVMTFLPDGVYHTIPYHTIK